MSATAKTAYKSGYVAAVTAIMEDLPDIGEPEKWNNDSWDEDLINALGYEEAKSYLGWDSKSESFKFGGDYNRGARRAVLEALGMVFE